jgi:flagellin-like hook-associated protein FlgL
MSNGTIPAGVAAAGTHPSTGTALLAEIAGIEPGDMATVALQLHSADISLQAALQTTASVKQMSLLNFLE